jgi:hypothetical protein
MPPAPAGASLTMVNDTAGAIVSDETDMGGAAARDLF